MPDDKPVVPRKRAVDDVEETLAYYQREARQQTAITFIDALETTFRLIGRVPGIGSPRFAVELELPGLRARQVARFPHLVFYVERADHIDVLRVLDGRRNIPAWMQGDDLE